MMMMMRNKLVYVARQVKVNTRAKFSGTFSTRPNKKKNASSKQKNEAKLFTKELFFI